MCKLLRQERNDYVILADSWFDLTSDSEDYFSFFKSGECEPQVSAVCLLRLHFAPGVYRPSPPHAGAVRRSAAGPRRSTSESGVAERPPTLQTQSSLGIL